MKSFFALRAKSIAIFTMGALCGVAYLISCGQVNVNEAVATGSATALKVKANGVVVGDFVSFYASIPKTGSSDEPLTWLKTGNGYFVALTPDGEVAPARLFFADTTCSTKGYIRYGIPKTVVSNSGSLYVVDSTAPTDGFSYESYRERGGACSTIASSGLPNLAMPVSPNNPAVTGVSQTSFTPPITIE